MGAKKLSGAFFKILPIFKMAAVFRQKILKIAVFDLKMAAILKIGEILKNPPYNLFAPICTPTWAIFSLIAPPQQKP